MSYTAVIYMIKSKIKYLFREMFIPSVMYFAWLVERVGISAADLEYAELIATNDCRNIEVPR